MLRVVLDQDRRRQFVGRIAVDPEGVHELPLDRLAELAPAVVQEMARQCRPVIIFG